MLFTRDAHGGIRSGEVTLTFRRWQRPQARAGGRYRIHPIGTIEVDRVDVVAVAAITAAEARRAGFASREALLARLGEGVDGDERVYRVEFRFIGEQPDARAALASRGDLDAAELEALRERLRRMDERAPGGPWTFEVLRLIEAHPSRRAGDLADLLGRERLPFKSDVRKLKALGLTESLEVGYRLSPRGRALLAATGAGDAPAGAPTTGGSR